MPMNTATPERTIDAMPASKTLLIAVFALSIHAALAASGPRLASGGPTVRLIAVVQERLGLQSATPSERLFLQPDRIARGEQPIQFTTSWNLGPSRTGVLVRAYFQERDGAAIELGQGRP